MSSFFFLFLFPIRDYFYTHKFELANRYVEIFFKISPQYDILYYKGISNAILGRFDRAIEDLEQLPIKDALSNYYLGLSYFELGKYMKAKNYLLLKDDIDQRYYYLALIHLKKEEIDEAKNFLKMAQESRIKDFYFNLLNDYETLKSVREKYHNGEYKEMIDLCSRVRNFVDYRRFYLALAYAEIKEFNKSLDLIDSLIQFAADSELVMEGIYQAGRINFTLENYKKSKTYFQKYLAKKENYSTKFLLGMIFTKENRLDSADYYFENLPDTVDEFLFFKGRTDYFQNQLDSAEERLSRHRALFPKSIYADRTDFILGAIKFKKNEYQKAIDLWSELINQYPNSIYAARAAKRIGDAHFNMREYQKALKSYKMVKKFNPTEDLKKETNLKIYETRYYLGQYPSLIDALRRFIETNPDSSESLGLVATTHLRIARILFEKKEYYSAVSELDRLLERYPNSPIIKDVYLEKAKIYHKMGELKEKKNALFSLLMIKNLGDYYYYTINELGSIYKDERKFDSALYYYNLLLKEEKYREMAIYEIAHIYSLLGQYEESNLMVMRLIEEYPKSNYFLDAVRLLVRSKKSQGDYNSVLVFLNDINNRSGPMPEIFLEIGNIYFEMRDYIRARENYLLASKYYKENRDNAAASLILAGDAAIALQDKNGARDLYLKAGLLAQSPAIKEEAMRKLALANE